MTVIHLTERARIRPESSLWWRSIYLEMMQYRYMSGPYLILRYIAVKLQYITNYIPYATGTANANG